MIDCSEDSGENSGATGTGIAGGTWTDTVLPAVQVLNLHAGNGR